MYFLKSTIYPCFAEANRTGLDLVLPVQVPESNVIVDRLPTPVETLPSISASVEEDFQQVPDYQSLNTRSRSITPQLEAPTEEAPKPRTTTEQIIYTHQHTPDTSLQNRKPSTTLPPVPSPQHVKRLLFIKTGDNLFHFKGTTCNSE